jgi:AraC family transcriptional regulator, L-rhamnose operon regulatory protein RhaS
MTTLHTHQAFDLVIYDLERWALPSHRHLFFELIYVLHGAGVHHVNQQQYPYRPGSLFLLTPADTHSVEVQTASRFCVIVFTKIYFTRPAFPAPTVDFGTLFQQVEYIFLNHNPVGAAPLLPPDDTAWIAMLIQRLAQETERKTQGYVSVCQQLLMLLLHELARAIQASNRVQITARYNSDLVYDVMSYIQAHIYDNPKLRLDVIASEFAKSKPYIGQHFREQTGETIKAYVIGYKLHLAKARLLYSQLSIAEIADELGFTDESHLNKTIKQRTGLTASEFRKTNTAAALPETGNAET